MLFCIVIPEIGVLLNEIVRYAVQIGSRVEDGRGVLANLPPRFPSPLIEPDVQISCIRLSDRFHRQTHGRAPRCTQYRRSTPSGPKITSSASARVPRVDTFCRLVRK